MEIQNWPQMEERCIQEEPAYCQAACPLGLDVRQLTEKIEKGSFAGAFRLFRKQVLFPQVVSRVCWRPCEAACVRNRLDISIQIGKLEASLCRYGEPDQERKYRNPVKRDVPPVHIVGGGLFGVSCAASLSEKGYAVKLYEKTGFLGGKLLLPGEKVQGREMVTREILDREFQRVTEDEKVEVFLNREVTNLGDWGEDPVILALGFREEAWGLLSPGEEKHDPISLQSGRKNVFAGGGLILGMEYNPIHDIACARRACVSVQRYLGGSSLTEGRENEAPRATRLISDLCQALPRAAEFQLAVNSPLATVSTREEAMTEARRCLQCQCKICVKACLFLDHYREYPKKYIREAYQSLNLIEKLSENISKRQINSCNLCGLCGQICPNGLDMSEIYLEARRILQNKGEMPPAFYDFFLEDMRFSNQEASVLLKGSHRVRYLFFPGCQLGASLPQTLIRTFGYLSEVLNGEAALSLRCCGAPAFWAGEQALHEEALLAIQGEWEELGRPTLLLACPNCYKQLRKFLPQVPKESLWTLLKDLEAKPDPARMREEPLALFDPCASREDPAGQQAVRALLKAWSIPFEELVYSGRLASCCGFGGVMKKVNPELAHSIAEARAGLSSLDYVTYCVNCRDTFLKEGKPARHLLECLFGWEKGEDVPAHPPTLSERKENRLKVKAALLDRKGVEEGWGKQLAMEEGRRPDMGLAGGLYIVESLLQKMERLYILRENVEKTVAYCETSGRKLRMADREGFTGHLRQGFTTYWVSYREKAGGHELLNVYCHRMYIELEENAQEEGKRAAFNDGRE